MKRVMIDTNVYEFILKHMEKSEFEALLPQRNLVFYGNSVIRKELREIPKNRKELFDGRLKSLRSALLHIYDALTGKHHYEITKQMDEVAQKYFIVYKTLGGTAGRKELGNDFLIVACATINHLDIVITEDVKTMVSDTAIKSYKSVNSILGFKTQNFIRFNEFKNMLRGVKLD